MKKLEYILYSLTLIILLIVIMGRTILWSWVGSFFIMSYVTLALVFMAGSWWIYSIIDHQNKRKFFLYGTIPLGFAIAVLILGTISKLQYWHWHPGAFRAAIFLFLITEIIFGTAYILIKDPLQKDFIKKLMLKVFVFISLTFVVIMFDFEKFISMISTKEANEIRELWRIESDSLYQSENYR